MSSGSRSSIDGVPAEIIGVLPASFRFLSKKTPALLLPMQVDRARAGFIEFDFQVLARLKPGVTLHQANADVGRMIPLLPQPFARLQMQPNVQPLVDSVTGDVGHILWILLAAAGVVLLIACGNVANLFLIRAEGRQQELAMRAALGASRGRIARVLLTESVLLALAGGVLAVAFAQAAIDVLQQAAPVHLPRVEEIGIDLTVLLFTVGISVLSGVMFGLFAVARFGTPPIAALKEGGRSSSDGPARLRARNALVVAQVSLALVLMVVSGLMIRTFIALRQVQPGFTQPSDVQTFRLDVPEGVVADPLEAARTYERIAERLAAVPGVTSVGLSSSITMDGEDNGNSVDLEDFPVPDGQLSPLWRFKSFGPGYFETMGNRVVAGRSVTWAEIHEERPVILISAALAREYWKEPSRALGKRVRTGSQRPWREIIGVVGDERDDGLNHPATKIVYWPLLNDSYEWRALAFALRSPRAGDATFLREVQQAVWSVNPNLPLATVQTLEEIQAHSMAQTSFAMAILGIAASVALLLGIVGIYGAIAYIATERTREIGIRIALGAQISDVRKLFLRQGLWLTATGIALGVVVALALSRVMSALLFGVGPADPLTYVAVSAALGAVALLATYLPARRASRVDPIVALRADA